jgi:hypothetical protein
MKAPENLGAEGDLRQEDEGLAAALERGGDGGEINFRLARTRHTVEQRDAEAARGGLVAQQSRRRVLIR